MSTPERKPEKYSEYYSNFADRVRNIAKHAYLDHTKAILFRVADDYDRMASIAGEIEAGQPYPRCVP